MTGLLPTARAVALWWTRRYTRDLPPAQRDRRLAEIGSDLWEEEAAGRVAGRREADIGFDVLLRVVAGVPADLAWRWASGRRLGVPWTWRITTMVARVLVGLGVAVTTVLGAYMVVNGTAIATEGHTGYGIVNVVAGALLLAGVGAATRSPRLSTGFVAVAVLTMVATHPWMIGAVAPAGALLVAAAVARTRRLRRLAAS